VICSVYNTSSGNNQAHNYRYENFCFFHFKSFFNDVIC
jgi:hypothetical protein